MYVFYVLTFLFEYNLHIKKAKKTQYTTFSLTAYLPSSWGPTQHFRSFSQLSFIYFTVNSPNFSSETSWKKTGSIECNDFYWRCIRYYNCLRQSFTKKQRTLAQAKLSDLWSHGGTKRDLLTGSWLQPWYPSLRNCVYLFSIVVFNFDFACNNLFLMPLVVTFMGDQKKSDLDK